MVLFCAYYAYYSPPLGSIALYTRYMQTMPMVRATKSIHRKPWPSIMWPMKVVRKVVSHCHVMSCENSVRYECIRLTMATVFRFRFTSMMCQMQNTIIAHRASPTSSVSQSMWRERSPKGMSMAMAINDVRIRLFMMSSGVRINTEDTKSWG